MTIEVLIAELREKFSDDTTERAVETIAVQDASIAAIEAENSALKEYAQEVTRGLTDLTFGGTEFFAGEKFGFYLADIPACVRNIKWRRDHAMRHGAATMRASAANVADSYIGHDARAEGALDAGEGFDLACDNIASAIRTLPLPPAPQEGE